MSQSTQSPCTHGRLRKYAWQIDSSPGELRRERSSDDRLQERGDSLCEGSTSSLAPTLVTHVLHCGPSLDRRPSLGPRQESSLALSPAFWEMPLLTIPDEGSYPVPGTLYHSRKFQSWAKQEGFADKEKELSSPHVGETGVQWGIWNTQEQHIYIPRWAHQCSALFQ